MSNNKLKGAGGVAFKLPSSDLPPVTPGDEGKYLGINEGGVVSWLNFSSQVLPAIVSGDDGKHLEVVDGKPAWTVPTGSLPKVTTTDSGKVMIVSTSGIWACDYLSLASVSGKLEIAHGGTGATTLAQAQENLGILPFPEPEVTDAGKVYGIDENGDIVLDYPPTEVPEPTATDVDKYISVKGANEYELKTLPAKQLPVPTASDVNKVPVVKGANEYELKELEDKVPTPTAADKDKVLRAQADGTYALTDETQEVPVPAATDKDKVLAATANGDYNLVEPSDGLPTVTTADDGKAMLVKDGKWEAGTINVPALFSEKIQGNALAKWNYLQYGCVAYLYNPNGIDKTIPDIDYDNEPSTPNIQIEYNLLLPNDYVIAAPMRRGDWCSIKRNNKIIGATAIYYYVEKGQSDNGVRIIAEIELPDFELKTGDVATFKYPTFNIMVEPKE